MQIHQPSLTAISNSTSRPILEQIVWQKQQEVAQMREQLPIHRLESQLDAPRAEKGFLIALRQRSTSLIAEVKKASPSKGVIRADFDPVAISQSYQRAGASCISVLTDQTFFQGSFEYLREIRQTVSLPLLCKEFIIDPYQIYLARSMGADAVLLIAAILSDQELQNFLKLAYGLGMNALVEVHTLAELDRVLSLPEVCLVGINNRNLTDFTVDLGTTQLLMAERRTQLDSLGITVVSESGLHSAADISLVAQAGVHAVLIGESLMKQPDVEQAIQNLFQPLSSLSFIS